MISILLALAASTQVLTLQQAEDNTHQNLPAVHLAVAQTAAQQAVRDEALSGYMPQISGNVSFDPLVVSTGGRALGSGATLSGTSALSQVFLGQTASFGASVNQLIYEFNQTIDRIKANDALTVADRVNESAVWNNALLSTREAYFNCQQNKQLIVVAQQNLDDQKGHVAEMTAFVQQGTHAPVDLAQAEQQEAAAMYQLVQSQGAYQQAKAALEQAMGLDSPPEFDVSDTPFPPVDGEESTTDALLPEALAARPDVVYLADEINAQRLTIASTRAGWAPSLSASAGASGNWARFDGVSSPVTPSAAIGLNLTWPLFLGGLTQAQTRQTEAVLVQLQAQLDAERQQVRNDVDNARIAIATAKGQLASAQQALAYAKEQLRLAEGQYQAGVGIALGVFDAEVAVFTAGGQVAQSVDALATGRAQLVRALGREKY